MKVAAEELGKGPIVITSKSIKFENVSTIVYVVPKDDNHETSCRKSPSKYLWPMWCPKREDWSSYVSRN